jgi:hypothetical protein
MIKTTCEGLKDFQVCERYYDFKFNDEIPEKYSSQDILEQRFENTLKKIIQFFWYKKQSGITPSYASLLNKWEKLWIPKGVDSYDISTMQNSVSKSNSINLTTKAAASLLAFHEEYSSSEYIPFSIDEEYFLTNNQVMITGVFDLILYKNGKTYVIKFVADYKKSKRHTIQFEFAAMRKAFSVRYRENEVKPVFCYMDITSEDMLINEFEIHQYDFDELDYWCDRLSSTEVFVPKRGLIPLCKKCPFDKQCSEWSSWKEEKVVKKNTR